MKLNQRTALLVVIPLILFAVTMGIVDYSFIHEEFMEFAINDVQSIGQIASLEMKNPMYNLDVDKLNEIIDSLESQQNIIRFLVLYPDGRILTDGTDHPDEGYGSILDDDFIKNSVISDEQQILVESNLIRFSTPIILNEKIGIIQIDYSLQSLSDRLSEFVLQISALAIVLIGIFGVLSIFFGRSITNPIQRIRKYLHQISEGKTDLDNEKFSIPEIQELHDGIHIMNRKLHDLQQDMIKTEKLATIGELTARISHDLRNPLTSISNSIQLIKTKNPELVKQNMKYFDTIEISINHINSEINNILLQTTTKVKKSPYNLFNVLAGAVDSIKVPDNITITKPKNDSKIWCDSKQLTNVFANIINNSVQAISEKYGDISILHSQDENFDKITISDNGPGIPDDSTEIIFEPLYTTKKYGTGLGLVNCKNIIQAHDGKIFAENLVSGGAMFTILLPKIPQN